MKGRTLIAVIGDEVRCARVCASMRVCGRAGWGCALFLSVSCAAHASHAVRCSSPCVRTHACSIPSLPHSISLSLLHVCLPDAQDTVTGLLLAGVGNVDTARKSNFLTVDSSTHPTPFPRATAQQRNSARLVADASFAPAHALGHGAMRALL